MSTKKQRAIDSARDRVESQRRWIEEHGGSVDAYVRRYGDSSAPEGPVDQGGRYGLGGQRIYEADVAALREYEQAWSALIGSTAPEPSADDCDHGAFEHMRGARVRCLKCGAHGGIGRRLREQERIAITTVEREPMNVTPEARTALRTFLHGPAGAATGIGYSEFILLSLREWQRREPATRTGALRRALTDAERAEAGEPIVGERW